jgi:hypothetical protein
MGKGELQRQVKLLEEYTEFMTEGLTVEVMRGLKNFVGSVVELIKDDIKNEDYVEKFVARAREARKARDKSPARKDDKKRSDKKKKEEKSEKSDAPKAPKKKKDPNAPKGVRNARTFFKIDHAADFKGLERKERTEKEGALFASLSADEKKRYAEMVIEDQKRLDRETELYKKGEFVPGAKAQPAAKKEAAPAKKEAEAKSPTKKTIKKKVVAEEAKAESSDDFSLGLNSD